MIILARTTGVDKIYCSCDGVTCDDGHQLNVIPVEFLNSLGISGMPPHKLKLNVDCIALFNRNLSVKKTLMYGT